MPNARNFLVYNNVQMNVIQLREYRMEPVYDDSNSDLMYHRHRLVVLAVVGTSNNGDLLPATNINGGFVSTDPPSTLLSIRSALNTPRGNLVWCVNGTFLLNIQQTIPAGNPGSFVTMDATNGPHPKSLSINKLTPGCFLVEFAVEATIRACPDNPDTAGICTFRYSQTCDYDRRWYCTKRTSGYLVVQSDLLRSPDTMRGLVTPSIDPAFQRTSAKYTLSEDGLRLTFEFIDVQQYKMPPIAGKQECAKAEGKFTIMNGGGSADAAAALFANCSVHLEGVPGQNTADLILVACAIITRKLYAATPVVQQGNIALVNVNLTEGLWDNIVDVSMTVRVNNSDVAGFRAIVGLTEQGAATPSRVFGTEILESPVNTGFPPRNDNIPNYGIAPPLYGKGKQLLMIAAALRDPCLANSANRLIRSPIDAQSTLQNANQTDSTTIQAFSQTVSDPEGANVTMASEVNSVPDAVGDAPDAEFSFIIASAEAQEAVDDGADWNTLIKDEDPGVWDIYAVESEYITKNHVMQLPTMQAGAAAALITLASPTKELLVTWTASRLGGAPRIPPATVLDTNTMLKEQTVIRKNIDVLADGVTPKYTITGLYHYVFANSDLVNEQYPLPPWLQSKELIDSLEEDIEGENNLTWGDQTPTQPAIATTPPVGA